MTDTSNATPSPENERSSRGPLVFISHDSRDADLAEAFSKLLGSVSAGMLKSFRSSDKKGSSGFEYGVEWYPELMKTLESACDVVCLLTERSLGRPWMLYEAGVAKGKLDIPVHGLALGVPLARAGVGLQAFKSKVEEVFAQDPGDEEADGFLHGEASTAKLFEEIKVMFQDLPSRLDHTLLRTTRESRLRLGRMHPAMLEEMIMMASKGERRAGVAALVMASLFRDDVPWIYEMGVEAYRASLLSDAEAERRAVVNFMRAVETMTMGPFTRELRMSRDLHMLLREMPMLLDQFLNRAEDRGDEEAESED